MNNNHNNLLPLNIINLDSSEKFQDIFISNLEKIEINKPITFAVNYVVNHEKDTDLGNNVSKLPLAPQIKIINKIPNLETVATQILTSNSVTENTIISPISINSQIVDLQARQRDHFPVINRFSPKNLHLDHFLEPPAKEEDYNYNAFIQEITTSDNSLEPQSTEPNLSGNYQLEALLSGFQWGFSWGSRQLTYSFYEDSIFAGSYYGSETGVREISDPIKNNIRGIFNWLETIIDVDFVEVIETANDYGRIRFMFSDQPNYAYAYFPSTDSLASVAGDVHLNPAYDYSGSSSGFRNPAGYHGYLSLVHEIGHALGLEHSHEGTSILPAAEDNTTNTVMSYNFTGSSAGSYMPYDIRALQYLYGAQINNPQDTTYQFTRVDQFQVNGVSPLNNSAYTKQTIWDSSGVDTLDFSSLSYLASGYRFDLNPGGILSTQSSYNGTSYTDNSVTYYTTTYGTAIAYNVGIENVINSSSNDVIFANSLGNTFQGYSSNRVTGHDILWHTNSLDVLDLGGYNFASVSQSQTGNDLILNLGSNGTVTVKDYYLGEQLTIFFADMVSSQSNNGSSLPTISISDVTVNENQNQAIFTVSLAAASSQIVSLNYSTLNGSAIAGSDYTAISGSLSFNPGELTKTITVNIINDSLYEVAETFYINLSNAENATIEDNQGLGTIISDDVMPSISINDLTVNESQNQAIFTVSLSAASGQVVNLNYSTANGSATAGSDYTAISGSLSFNPGETSKTIAVNIINDTLVEAQENFYVNLSNVQNATVHDSQGVGTIISDDVAGLPTISINDISQLEGTGVSGTKTPFIFTVSLSQSSSQIVTVKYATANGNAYSGLDYMGTNGTLTFNPGDTSKTITVQVYAEKMIESNETFFVNLSIPTNATIADNQGKATILNDDASATIPSNTQPLTTEDSLLNYSSETITSSNNYSDFSLNTNVNNTIVNSSSIFSEIESAYLLGNSVNNAESVIDIFSPNSDLISLNLASSSSG